MATLILEGGQIITPTEELNGDIAVNGSVIEEITRENLAGSCERLNVRGSFVTPGLFDLQVNGTSDCDLWADPTAEDLAKMRGQLAKCGVTSFLPTLITDDLTHLKKNISFLASQGAGATQVEHNGKSDQGARMPGIHLEGPCLSPEKPGVHPPKHLQTLSEGLMHDLIADQVKLITLAPELDKSGKAIALLKKHGICASLGHSNATFAEAMQAFELGVGLMTHTFNALPPLHHRAPGAVGAAFINDNVTCCVIPDGQHVDPAMVGLILKVKGRDKVIFVTDSAHIGTSQGGLVGSSITLDQAVRNVVQWKLASFADAILMATLNPAKAMGLDKNIGSLAKGKLADIVVWDKQTLAIKHVIMSGNRLF
jgi:N-acetylglucosamine-6-phosphate deacetylase